MPKLVAKNSFMIDEFLAKLDADGELGINWLGSGTPTRSSSMGTATRRR